MDLYSQKSKSIPQKIVIHLFEILLLYISYWLLFKDGGNYIQERIGIYNAEEATIRRNIVFIFSIITFFRFGYMMFFMLKRKIPWEESISVPMVFSLYYLGFSILVLPTNIPLDYIDFLGIFIFISGSTINTYSEVLRNNWKKDPKNKGKLYTRGLFKYSMHINYFGDVLWVTGFAILTRNWYAILIPFFLLTFFVFYNIPILDKHLKNKYRGQFNLYAKKTKKLIPFIY